MTTLRTLGAGALLVLALAPAPALAASVPWYESKECDVVARLAYSGEFDRADAVAKKMEASKDPDEIACGVWLHAVMPEHRMAWEGQTPALLEAASKSVARMAAFSRSFRDRGERFKDLEGEARLRRVRQLFQAGSRSEAVKEARRIREIIDEGHQENTPTRQFVVGMANCVIAYSPWVIRSLLQVAGISGDGDAGRAAMADIRERPGVYRYEAWYMTRGFSLENRESPIGEPLEYSTRLAREFPESAQFAFEHGSDLRDLKRCKEALPAIEPMLSRVQAEPNIWGRAIRTKLAWLAAACAVEVQDKDAARKWLAVADAQHYEVLRDQIDRLKDAL